MHGEPEPASADKRVRQAAGARAVSTSPRDVEQSGSVVWRAIAIIEQVAQAGRPVPVSELMQHLALPKPTAHRLCNLLERMGLLQRGPDSNAVVTGSRLATLALDVIMNSGERGARRAILRALVEATGETCTMTMLDGGESVVLERVESFSALRVQLHSGSRVPLHCTASGKLFLSMLDHARCDRLIKSMPLRTYTSSTITDPALLEAELKGIRAERFATDREEFMVGLIAIAVPVTNRHGRVCAAVSINAPAARLKLSDAIKHMSRLTEAAGALAKTLPA